MVKRHSRKRRDPDAPSKTPERKKSVPVQNTEHAKKSRLSENSGRFGQHLSGKSDKRIDPAKRRTAPSSRLAEAAF